MQIPTINGINQEKTFYNLLKKKGLRLSKTYQTTIDCA